MASARNPRIGVIADTTLQRHVVCKAVETAGYAIAHSLPPDKAEDAILRSDTVDAWLVDIEDEDQWADFIVRLFDIASAPVLLGEGHAPSVSSLQYARWEQKILAKLQDMVGVPLPEAGLPVLGVTEAAVIPPPKNPAPAQPAGEPASNIWLLGASLGGPNAVKEFLDALPSGLPLAFVIAQHIDAGFEDTLCKVWGKNSAFSFVKPEPGNRLSHGQIVIAPIEQVMCVNGGAELVLFEEPWQGPYSPCIDQAMSLLADNLGQQTGAILFSGMGNDGSVAACKLKNMNIPVWAQSADTCANSSMPDSARATGCVSYSGSPAQLAQHLVDYAASHLAEPINL